MTRYSNNGDDEALVPLANNPRRSSSSTIGWRHKTTHELCAFLNLMIPTVIIQCSFTICPFLTASYVGRTFGSIYLDSFTLAYLTGNLTTLSLLAGLYSASDTLSPQAFGAGNHFEVGLIAIRGFVGSMCFVLPVNVALCIWLKPILIWVGEDEEASQHASDWYRIYIVYIPFYAIYCITWKFLSAQNIMKPLVVVCIISTCVILPISLEFFTQWFGFLGSAMAVVTFQISQALLLLFYLYIFRPHAPTCWPAGMLSHWKDALEWEDFKTYMHLGFGGILMSSEWIYWEVLSLMIGTLGVVPLSVHTVPTQFITVFLMVPLGCGTALAIRLGNILPSYHGGVRHSKVLVGSCFVVSILVFGAVSTAMYHWRHQIYSVFINEEIEPEVWAGCDEIWWMVSSFYFNVSIFLINMGIATGLGMQWTLGLITVFFLWVFGFPAAWYAAQEKAHVTGEGIEGLVAAWKWINPPYTGINLALIVSFVLKDWYMIRDTIREREVSLLMKTNVSPGHPSPLCLKMLVSLHVETTVKGMADPTLPQEDYESPSTPANYGSVMNHDLRL